MTLGSPLAATSLVDQAFEQLADAIARGELKPGERIRESFLAREMGISRGVLREAVHRLEGRKLVRRTSNIGVHVLSLTDREANELFTMREVLEGLAARLAAQHMSVAEISKLKRLLDAHERQIDVKQGSGYFQRPIDDFHVSIALGSKNSRLASTLCDDLYHQLRLYRYRSSVIPGRTRSALAEHHAIVDAIARRDPDAAEAAMRGHLAHARASLP
jgi:DNA-binding GntR family transcriptional regulator